MRRSTWRKTRLIWRKTQRFIKYHILHVDDTPHRIALSAAIGVFIAWTPTPGFQIVLAVVLCALLRANKIACIPTTWLSNALTTLPMFYAGYIVGTWCLPGEAAVDWAQWSRMAGSALGPGLPIMDRLRLLGSMAADVALPLWIGTAVLGLLSGALTYWWTYTAIVKYRRHKALKRHLRAAGV